MEIECFPVTTIPPQIRPGSPERDWMDVFAGRHPYKCLPLTMANTTGWEILCPVGFTAEWNGGPAAADITLTMDRPKVDPRKPFVQFNAYPGLEHLATSHFAGGVLTFHTGYLFRTPPGWAMWAMGAPNHVKDGIQALAGLIETDWLPFPFTMNWKFTRPGKVHFEKDEPFCFFTLQEHQRLDAVQPVLRDLKSDPDLNGQYEAWGARRTEFNAALVRGEPEAVKEAWQRFYFKGLMPDASAPAPKDHVNKRRLKALKRK